MNDSRPDPAQRLEAFLASLENLFPQGFSEDMRRNLRALVQAQLSKFDWVSQDEFEAQKAVLERTRLRLQALEQELERLSQTPP